MQSSLSYSCLLSGCLCSQSSILALFLHNKMHVRKLLCNKKSLHRKVNILSVYGQRKPVTISNILPYFHHCKIYESPVECFTQKVDLSRKQTKIPHNLMIGFVSGEVFFLQISLSFIKTIPWNYNS